ncbi:MAG: SDR family NAD(P)-dependent oxidoreductase [Patescibacteria group bacterium]
MKIAVLTGASRGIGLATAKLLIKRGWRVIGTHNQNIIPIKSDHLVAIKLDLASPKSIAEAVKKIKQEAATIDALINNAATLEDALDEKAVMEKIRTTLEVNLLGTINFTEGLLPLLHKGSQVININSVYGSFSFPVEEVDAIGYRLSKAALNMYTRILAFGLKNKGIIVSSLDPGWVKTDMGNIVANELEGPDREPEQPAQEILDILESVKETGQFWRFGEKREW